MRAPARTTTLGPASALVILLALGLALRVIIAYQLPGSGFSVDLASFQFWAHNLADRGPFGFYDRGFFADYTPGYLYLLWVVGVVGQAMGGIGDLIKVPAMLADIALAWLAWSMVRELGGSTRTALVAAAIVLFTPITWFDSVVWGQVDSVGAVVLLLAVRELWRDRPERATALGTLAAIIKPQLGIIVPIAAAVILRRYVWDPWIAGRRAARTQALDGTVPVSGEDPAAAVADAAELDVRATRPDGWFDRFGRGPARLVTSAAVGILTATLVSAPFGLTPIGLIVQVVKTAGGYPYLTVNAYNPWAWFTSAGGAGLAQSGQWLCDAVAGDPTKPVAEWACPPGSETLIFGIPAVVIGTGILVLAVLGIAYAVFRRPDRRTILVATAVIALAFFVLPTRVHERYLFPLFALGAILAAVSWRWAAAYVALSAATFANMYVVLTTLYPGNPSISDWLGIGSAIRSWTGVAVVAAVHLLGFAWAATQLRPAAIERLELEFEGAGDLSGPAGPEEVDWQPGAKGWHEGLLEAGPSPVVGREESAATAMVDASGSASGSGSAERTGRAGRLRGGWVAAVTRRPGPDEPGMWAAIRRRTFVRPLRPDRTRSLFGESTGRLDRLDLWFVLVVVIAALTLRTFRLSEPYDMHFDEVYHARTATEFLQDWRYGIPHSIYEYTHPHLAKYGIAAGIVAFGDDRVTAESKLGVSVRDAAIEPRWDDAGASGVRAGDRVYVATGSEVRAYDLLTRALVATFEVPGADAVAVDPTGHRLFVGTSEGTVLAMATPQLDARRASGAAVTASDPSFAGPATFADAGAPISRLLVQNDGSYVLAVTTTGRVVSMDGALGSVLGGVSLPGVMELADAGTGEALVASPADVTDPGTEAALLSQELGGDEAGFESKLRASGSQVVVAGPPAPDVRTRLDAEIADGRLAGLSFVQLPRIAAADAKGVAFIEPTTASVVQSVDMDAPATGLALVSDLDAPRLYVASGLTVKVINLGNGSDTAGQQLTIESTLAMPGPTRDVTYDPSSVMVHVLGTTSDGSSPTIYVIEPHGNAVYADARLPFQPAAWATDTAKDYPSADRQAILAFASDGSMASVDIGRHAFAWRLPGVILGGLTAGLLYLLARILFRRRSVGAIVAVLALADGMFFVQSRIAMNDVYVGFFIVAAYTIFAAVWTGFWRWRGAFWIAMPLVGLLLGLGLASKWVALYAIAALGVLILARSALGRIILVAGMIAGTTVLGYIAISVPSGETSNGNFTFMLIMLALTLVATLVTVLHPISWSPDEVRFAIGAPFVVGVVILAAALPLGLAHGVVVEVAFGFVLLAAAAAIALRVAGGWGFGPLAPPADPDDPVRLLEPPAPAAEGWLRLGSGFGLPAAWIVGCLLVLPVAVYVISYLPWVALGNRLTDSWPPGNQGQTLLQLTQSMYDYHNNLRATHAASSPWWAWPLDFKPVWFYQGSFAAGTAGSIYDAGNLVIWWLGLPALAFCAWQAFKRRSLGLALILIGFAWQWLSWSRIDRATFQYHYYTSLPFVFLALAYLIAEVWHGPSIRTWLLVRLAAAAALLGPGILWLSRVPLCAYVRVTAVDPGSQACSGVPPGQLVLTMRTAAMGVVMLVAAIALIREVVRLEGDGGEGGISRLGRLAATAGVATLGLTLVLRVVPDQVVFSAQSFAPEALALVILVPLGFVAWFVVTARDARRFAAGAIAAAIVWFVILYPNISALPLPSILVNAYQGLLPTYLYPFQFPVNTDPPGPLPKLLAFEPMVLFVALALTCLVVAYSASVWRVVIAERKWSGRADEGDALQAGAGGGAR